MQGDVGGGGDEEAVTTPRPATLRVVESSAPDLCVHLPSSFAPVFHLLLRVFRRTFHVLCEA